jgi:ATP-dependent DNA helicase RecQ
MERYAKSNTCLRRRILEYFGDSSGEKSCGNCGPCTAGPVRAAETTADDELFQDLRNLRRQFAEEENVPPYIIFSDATLREMARVKPRNRTEMLTVTGVGAKRYERYGEQFLAITKPANPRPLPALPPKISRPSAVSKPEAMPARDVHENRLPGSAKRAANGRQLTGTLLSTLDAAKDGATSTVASHMAELVACGEIEDISPWVDESMLVRIRAAAGDGPITAIAPLKEALGEDITYEQLHLARTYLNIKAREA